MFTQKYRSEIIHSTSVSGPGSSPAGKGRRCIVLEAKGETRGRRRSRGRPRGRGAEAGRPLGAAAPQRAWPGGSEAWREEPDTLSLSSTETQRGVRDRAAAGPSPTCSSAAIPPGTPHASQTSSLGFQENRSHHTSLSLLHQALWEGLSGGLPPLRGMAGSLDSGSPPGQHRKAHAPLCQTGSLRTLRGGVRLLWLRGGGHRAETLAAIPLSGPGFSFIDVSAGTGGGRGRPVCAPPALSLGPFPVRRGSGGAAGGVREASAGPAAAPRASRWTAC